MESAIMDLVAVVSVLGASLGLGFLKRHTAAMDGAVGRAIKPFQPAIVALAGVGLPYLTSALDVVTAVDPHVFVTAPTATIATVTAREIIARLRSR